jgi:hypothetical protein
LEIDAGDLLHLQPDTGSDLRLEAVRLQLDVVDARLHCGKAVITGGIRYRHPRKPGLRVGCGY